MPESGQHPDDQKIGDRSGISFAVSSQWNIHILTEPSAQRYMPSSPEFCHTRRYIRVMEVLQKLKSEHLSKTDRHIRISAEIKINLECIRNTSDPRSHHRIAAQMHRCDLLKNRSCRICKNYLLASPRIKYMAPCPNLVRFINLCSNCSSISTYRTIGPAISCGNIEI